MFAPLIRIEMGGSIPTNGPAGMLISTVLMKIVTAELMRTSIIGAAGSGRSGSASISGIRIATALSTRRNGDRHRGC